ncbi:triple tyrosine motif-containing protein [Silvibacterium sp.]|uniref:ATP-binding protein n=1 Tax=Silvibacterium sp. TaxID=1964179 RepID=UPI0039E3EF72
MSCAAAPLMLLYWDMRRICWMLLTVVFTSACLAFAQAAIPVVSQASPAHLAPARSTPQAAPVQARILGWSTTSELLSSAAKSESNIVVEAGRAELVFFFAASPAVEGTVFRYRLDDYDADWTETRGTLAHYRRLPPGSYRFEVQARSPQSGWSSPEAVLHVEQKPFFYQTWYAYVLIGVIVLVIAAQLLRQHDQLLKGQMGVIMEERNRIASDCHDTLMAGLAAVSWQLEATAKLFRSESGEQGAAASACELARSMAAHCQAEARRIIWDLRNATTITTSLSEALTEALGAHRQPEGISTMVEVHGSEIPIAPGAVHHLVCIGQEAVSNAIRHSGSSLIHVDLRYESGSLCLSVRDNGQGFQPYDATARTGHFGISVMEERARKLGGQFRLNSAASSGTEVTVTVSFNKIHQPSGQQQVVPWIGL